jgi:hypothetical protein
MLTYIVFPHCRGESKSVQNAVQSRPDAGRESRRSAGLRYRARVSGHALYLSETGHSSGGRFENPLYGHEFRATPQFELIGASGGSTPTAAVSLCK